jgi:aspartyl-tRNA(Asn)/glutamyl-tRNA(Gln) amidotransferase subunit A
VSAALARIERLDPMVGAFTDVLRDRAGREALASDAREHSRPLDGVPLGVKGLFDVEGGDQSYGSSTRDGLRGSSDAEVVRRLRRAGGVVVGVTRTHELGWGITTQHASRGSTRNPWNLERVPGGSSGGSAAAVAAGLVPIAVGSDTGGSIRIPAAFCGVIGLKTTHGRIPRTGGVALAPSFDSPGFLSLSPALLVAALVATAGEHAGDSATVGTPPLGAMPRGLATGSPLRYAAPESLAPAQCSSARASAIDRLCAALDDLGFERVEVTAPSAAEMYEVFVPIQQTEAHDVHHRVLGTFPSRAGDYGPDVRQRLERAGLVTTGEYLAARATAAEMSAALHRAVRAADILVTLVGGHGPSRTDAPDTVDVDGRPVPLRDLVMPSTVPQNLAGLPSVTVPVGLDDDGMPIGVQLTGPRWTETTLLAITELLERTGVLMLSIAPEFRN